LTNYRDFSVFRGVLGPDRTDGLGLPRLSGAPESHRSRALVGL